MKWLSNLIDLDPQSSLEQEDLQLPNLGHRGRRILSLTQRLQVDECIPGQQITELC